MSKSLSLYTAKRASKISSHLYPISTKNTLWKITDIYT